MRYVQGNDTSYDILPCPVLDFNVRGGCYNGVFKSFPPFRHCEAFDEMLLALSAQS